MPPCELALYAAIGSASPTLLAFVVVDGRRLGNDVRLAIDVQSCNNRRSDTPTLHKPQFWILAFTDRSLGRVLVCRVELDSATVAALLAEQFVCPKRVHPSVIPHCQVVAWADRPPFARFGRVNLGEAGRRGHRVEVEPISHRLVG